MNRYLLPGVVFCGLVMMVGMTIAVLAQDTIPEDDVLTPTLTPTAVVEVEEDHTPNHQAGKGGKGGGPDNAPGQNKEAGGGAPITPPDNNGQPPVTNGPDEPPANNGNNGEPPTGNGPEVVPPPVSDQPPGNSDGEGPPPETHSGGPPPAVEGRLPDAPVVPPPAQDNVPEQVTDEVSVEVEAVAALILGQVESRARVSVTLTTPGGQSISQAADEGGVFRFEVMEPGEYRLVASAPGFLSRHTIFTLAAGQQLELPLTSLTPGDLNQDSRIDLNDIMLVAANYNGPALVAAADLNGDSWIDIRDLTIIGTKFGATGPLPWDLS